MKTSGSFQRKLRLFGKLCLPLLTSVVVGCGSSSDGGTTVAAAGNGGGGGGNVPTPTGSQQQFAYSDFAAGSRATVVVGNTPTAERTSAEATVAVAVNQSFGALGRFSLSRREKHEVHSGCATADIAILKQLMGPSEPRAQAAPTVLKRYQELEEGAQEDFQIILGSRTMRAEKVLAPGETVRCTIFAELDGNGEPCISRSKALMVAQAFDSNNPARPGSGIYDQVRAVFGSEWTANGGIDGDSKIVLLFFRSATLGSGLYGFTSPIDSDPDATSFSNHAEILYLNADKNEQQTLSTLAHEFQHLICENQKIIRQGTFPAGAVEENVSLNEGLSELAEEVCGFTLEQGNTLLADYINDYLSRPEEHELFNFNATGVAYGQGYLFYRYLREHYGDNTIRSLATSDRVGMANLESVPNGFRENFRRWTIANWATNLSGAPAIYQYPSGFRTNGTYAAGSLSGVVPFELGNGQTASYPGLGAWSAAYFTFANGNGSDLSLTVDVPANSSASSILEQAQGSFTRLD